MKWKKIVQAVLWVLSLLWTWRKPATPPHSRSAEDVAQDIMHDVKPDEWAILAGRLMRHMCSLWTFREAFLDELTEADEKSLGLSIKRRQELREERFKPTEPPPQ